jgi:hypothetical protein
MDDVQNAGTPDPNDKLEDEVLKPIVDDEIKTKVLEKFGLNEDDNPELVEKLVEEEKENHKKLSTAISQKRKWREQAQTAQKPADIQQPVQPVQQATTVDVERLVEEKLNERDLKTMQLSDELKGEVKKYAKANGMLYSEAVNTPYISYMKEKEEEQKRSEEASISTKSKGTRVRTDFSNLKPGDYANMEPEAKKAYKDFLKKQ